MSFNTNVKTNAIFKCPKILYFYFCNRTHRIHCHHRMKSTFLSFPLRDRVLSPSSFVHRVIRSLLLFLLHLFLQCAVHLKVQHVQLNASSIQVKRRERVRIDFRVTRCVFFSSLTNLKEASSACEWKGEHDCHRYSLKILSFSVCGHHEREGRSVRV